MRMAREGLDLLKTLEANGPEGFLENLGVTLKGGQRDATNKAMGHKFGMVPPCQTPPFVPKI
eukprot:5095266-Amphidinium_carterae.1